MSRLVLLVWLFVAACGAYTIVLLPDTQMYTVDAPDLFMEQATWVCNNRHKLDIRFVSHEGDLVHNYDTPKQWETARDALAILERCGVPYTVLPGNHDVRPSGNNIYKEYDASFPWIPSVGNASFPPGTRRNSYYADSESRYLFLALEYMWNNMQYRDELLSWVDSVILSHPGWNVFVTSHFAGSDCDDYVHPDIMALMHRHCNIQMVFGGHVFECEGQREVPMINACGQRRYALTSNYQYREKGGNGWLRFYTVRGDAYEACAFTYSTRLNQYEINDRAWFSLRDGMSSVEVGCKRPDFELLSGFVPPSFLEMFVIVVTMTMAFVLSVVV